MDQSFSHTLSLPNFAGDDLLAAIVRSSSDAIIAKDLDGTIISWNPAAEHIMGYTAAEIVGRSIRTLIPADRQHEEDAILARLRAGEAIPTFETKRLTAKGVLKPVSVTVSPVRDSTGAIVAASKILRDLSERSAMRRQLMESEKRFETLADNMAQLAWMADQSGSIFWYNRRWYEYTGSTFDQMKGWGWRTVHHPDHLERVVARYQSSLETGELWEDLFPLRGRHGEYRWFLSRAMPVRDESDQVIRWMGTNTDVTDQRAQQDRIQMLMAEVNHRAKNMLSMIQALARRTAPRDRPEFITRFEQRISALSANQDLLIRSEWRGAPLDELVRTHLAYVDDLIGKRIHVGGPDLLIRPSAAETLGLALHELCTNASKYGALSTESGDVRIGWATEPREGGTDFVLSWTESGGPPCSMAGQPGFGTTVTDRLPRMSLQATIRRDYGEAGLCWQLRCDVGQVIGSGSAEVQRAPVAPRTGGAVLIVEDEALVALDLVAVLEDRGFTVVGPAATVEQAMELLDRHQVSLAILDVNLGRDETSEPVAKRLKREGTRFFVTSGYSEQQRAPVFNDVPSFDKPVNISLIVSAVEGACR